MTVAQGAVQAICLVAMAGVIGRPWRLPEWVWAVGGASLLTLSGLLPAGAAGQAVAKGTDVYLFLIGMMLLSETARTHGLFDWVAATAVNAAAGSRPRLFFLIYATGIVVTAFLSNDATAVVLTPAVYAVARKARADPLPLLFACALVANAASFVLPISNPANLVLYGGHMPPLGEWFASFALPSAASIVLTFVVLRLVFHARIVGTCACDVERAPLSAGGRAVLAAILLTALSLVGLSAFDIRLGPPTAMAGIVTALGVSVLARRSPAAAIRSLSWGVLPLVAGLFVLVEALSHIGITAAIARGLAAMTADGADRAGAIAGIVLALAANVMNNLPAGLIAADAAALAQVPKPVIDGLLIGIDLGPNLSVTGSLATILWLQAIRREGGDVGFGQFLRVGLIAMPAALLAALAARFPG